MHTVKNPETGTVTNLFGASDAEAKKVGGTPAKDAPKTDAQTGTGPDIEALVKEAAQRAYEQGLHDAKQAAAVASGPVVAASDTPESGYFPDEVSTEDNQTGGEARTNEETDEFKAVADVVGERAARIFAASGLTTLATLDASPLEALDSIDQIGPTTIDKLRARRAA
jgi:hypothetical protein